MSNFSTYTEDERAHVVAMLDRRYYFSHYPDIEAAGLDPAIHYLESGWIEGRNPCATFDTAFYLRTNPDIAQAKVNPFYHYLVAGRSEGRRAMPDPWHVQLEAARSMESRIADWRYGRVVPILTDVGHMADEIAKAAVSSLGFVISVSHDDFRKNTGGLQSILQDERKSFEEAAWSYLHVSPVYPLPVIAEKSTAAEHMVFLSLNGQDLGACRFSDMLEAIGRVTFEIPLRAIIHHLFGHPPELMTLMLNTLGIEESIFWVHDFASLCSNYALLRNDIKFCYAPHPTSAACTICSYGGIRADYIRRITAFFEAVRPFVLAPSAFALDFWKSHTTMPYRDAAVVAPAKLVMATAMPRRNAADQNIRKLRVAHLGYRSFYKGWPIFVDLASGADKNRYEFFQIGGTTDADVQDIKHVDAMATPSNPNAMMKAVVCHSIDIVVQWSQCAETFNFTTLEALAAGTFVVARREAGNVWPAIKAMAPSQGMAIEDESELKRLFAGNELFRRIDAGNRYYGAVVRSTGTAEWLLARNTTFAQAALLEMAS